MPLSALWVAKFLVRLLACMAYPVMLFLSPAEDQVDDRPEKINEYDNQDPGPLGQCLGLLAFDQVNYCPEKKQKLKY